MSNKLVKNNKALDEISEKIDELKKTTYKECIDIAVEKFADIFVKINLIESNRYIEISEGLGEICNSIVEGLGEIAEHCEISNDVVTCVELYDENSMLFKSSWHSLRVLFGDINLNDEIKQLWLGIINNIWLNWISFILKKYNIKTGESNICLMIETNKDTNLRRMHFKAN